MTTEDIKTEELRNALEARNTTPSYIDLSESHKNDDMYALKKNVLRVQWEPTMDNGTNLYGQVQWNNIQPPNLQTGLSKMYIECEFDINFTITSSGDNLAANETAVAAGFDEDHLFMQDINAALYNTQISMTGQSQTGQPYIDLAIKRLYDPDFHDDSLSLRSHDKNVYWTYDVDTSGDHKVVNIHYEISTPLIHPFFSSENDLAGINAFTINTQYNLTQLFNIHKGITQTTGTATTITPALTKLRWRICYNQINYEKSLDDYATLLMWEAYFTEKNQSNAAIDANHMSTQLFINNVRDIPSTPICQYSLIVRKVDDLLFTTGATTIAAATSRIPFDIPSYRLTNIDITVNSNSNAYNSQTFRDIVHCCKQAGYCGCAEELTEKNKKYPQVYGFSSLQYRNVVGSANTYRFNVGSSNCYINAPVGINYNVFYVMLQPALFIGSTQGSSFVNNLGVSYNDMVKSDSDVDEYIKLIKASGYSGGSLGSWFKNLRDKLKKSRFISNAGKAISGVMGNDAVKSIASSIPVVGSMIGANWDKAKDVIDMGTSKAEELGYGVSRVGGSTPLF